MIAALHQVTAKQSHDECRLNLMFAKSTRHVRISRCDVEACQLCKL